MQNRGLASILSVSLITLGVVIAVSLLWFFVSKNITPQGNTISPDCFTADLSVKSCQTHEVCNYFEGGKSYEANVLVQRGSGKADITGIRFSFEDWLGRILVNDTNLDSYSLEELESLRFKDYPAKIPTNSQNSYLKISPLIGPNKDVCPLQSKSSLCPLVGVAIPFGANRPGQCCQSPHNYSECYNGQDANYPITNGIVYYNSEPYSFGTPPGNISVCCSS